MIFTILISAAFATHSFKGMTSNPNAIEASIDVSIGKNDLVVVSTLDAALTTDGTYKVGYGTDTALEGGDLMKIADYPTTAPFKATKKFDLTDVLNAATHSHVAGATVAGETVTVDADAALTFIDVPTFTLAKSADAAKVTAKFTSPDNFGVGPFSLRKKAADNSYTSVPMTKGTAASNADSTFTGDIGKSQLFSTTQVVLGFLAEETPDVNKVSELIETSLGFAPGVGLKITENGKLQVGAALTAADDLIFVNKADLTGNATFTATAEDLTPQFAIDGKGAAFDLLVAKGKETVPTTLSAPITLTKAPTMTYALAKTAVDDSTPKIVATVTEGMVAAERAYLKAPLGTEEAVDAKGTTTITVDIALGEAIRKSKTDNLYLYKKTAGEIGTSPIIVPASTITFKNGAATDTDMVYDFQITAGSLPYEPATLLVYPDGETPDMSKSHVTQLVWTDTVGKATASYKYAELDADTTFKAVIIPYRLTEPVNMPTELITDSIAAPKSKPAPEPEASFSVVASFVLALTSIAVFLF